MKPKLVVVLVASLLGLALAVAMGLLLSSHSPTWRGHDAKDLTYWSQVGGTQDWSRAAAQGDAQAQFNQGFALIRTNFTRMIDRVPVLSGLPVVGERWFEKRSYGIGNDIGQDRLAEAYRWFQLSAAQGFAPAKEAETLFRGRIATQTVNPTRTRPSE